MSVEMRCLMTSLLLLFSSTWSWLSPPSSVLGATIVAVQSCPSPCQCSTDFTKVTCTGRQLDKVPDDLPVAVQRLTLDDNRITEIKVTDFSWLVDLRWLSIKKNLIINIEDGAFQDQANLTNLFLTHNKLGIGTLTKEMFRGLDSLQHLYMEQNDLAAIPDASHMPNLRVLSLDFNQITNATFSGYSDVKKLQSITLSNNRIESLSPESFANLNPAFVTKISLSRNKLQQVSPSVFDKFVRLMSLDVSHNPTSQSAVVNIINSLENTSLNALDLDEVVDYQLPAELFSQLNNVPLKVLRIAHSNNWVIQNGTFEALSALNLLDLSSSKMVVFQDGVFRGLSSLTRLQLQNNSLNEVPMGLPPSLNYLDLSNNYFDTLPANRLDQMANLTNLTMSNGRIHTVYEDALVGLSRLMSLDLSNNQLGSTSLPKQLFDPVQNLVRLNLTKNKLSDIKNESKLFAKLSLLLELSMAENGCHTLPFDIFHSLTSLRSLDLHGNKLGYLMATDTDGQLFKELSALQELNLNDSRITYLPKLTFSKLSSLQVLHIGGNYLFSWDQGLFSGLSHIQFIDLTENSISLVNQSSLFGLRYGAQLDLSGNPFACWCDLIWFREWMDNPNSTFLNADRYVCNSPAQYAHTPLLSFKPADIHSDCHKPPWKLIISVSVAGGVALVLIIINLFYRYRWPLRRKWYLLRRRQRQLAFRNRGHDAYEKLDGENDLYHFCILYHESDLDWVRDTLVARIAIDETEERHEPQDGVENDVYEQGNVGDVSEQDNVDDVSDQGNVDDVSDQGNLDEVDVPNVELEEPKPHKWKVFFEYGSLTPNQIAIKGITDAIERSQRSILVVSKQALLSSKFCDYELYLAVENTQDRGLGFEGLILIMLEDIVDKLPKILYRIDDERRVTWTDNDDAGQRLFWEKLEDELKRYPEPIDV